MVSASEDSTPSIIYHCVLRGLERLLLSEQLSRMDGEALVKLSVDRVNMPSPHRAMAALGLMLTCMYTGKQGFNMTANFNVIKNVLLACWLNHWYAQLGLVLVLLHSQATPNLL